MAYSYKAARQNTQNNNNGQTGNTTRSSGYSYSAAREVGANEMRRVETQNRIAQIDYQEEVNRIQNAADTAGKYLQNYYDALNRAGEYAGGFNGNTSQTRSVTDYQPYMNELSGYYNQRNDMLEAIRTAYGENSDAEKALNYMTEYQSQLMPSMGALTDYAARVAGAPSTPYAGMSLTDLESMISDLGNQRTQAAQSGQDTKDLDQQIANAQDYINNNYRALTFSLSPTEAAQRADALEQERDAARDDMLRNGIAGSVFDAVRNSDGIADAARNVAGVFTGGIEQQRTRNQQIEALRNRVTYSEEQAARERTQRDLEALISPVMQDRPAITSESTGDEVLAHYGLGTIPSVTDHVTAEDARARMEEINKILPNLHITYDGAYDNDADYDRDILAYEALSDEYTRLSDLAWNLTQEETLAAVPEWVSSAILSGNTDVDIRGILTSMGYDNQQISDVLNYGKRQRDAQRMAEYQSTWENYLSQGHFGSGSVPDQILAGTMMTLLPRTLASLTSGVGVVDQIVQMTLHPARPVNYNNAIQRFANTDEIISDTIMNAVDITDRNGTDWFDKSYSFATSTIDSVVAGLVAAGLGEIAGGIAAKAGLANAAQIAEATAHITNDAIFFGSAAQAYAREAVANGATDQQVLLGSIFAGTAEALFEEWSIGAFYNGTLGIGKVQDALRHTLIEMGINASEEFNTEIANIITDWLIMGGISDVTTMYNDYIARGYTEAEAQNMTFFAMAGRAIEAGVSGALQGFVMNTVSTARARSRTSNLGRTISDAGRVMLGQQTGTDLTNASNFDVGAAFAEAYEATRADLVSKSTIRVYLRNLGVDEKNVDRMVSIINKALLGVAPTAEESKFMQSDKPSAEAWRGAAERGYSDIGDQLFAQADANRRLVALAESTGDIRAVLEATSEATGNTADAIYTVEYKKALDVARNKLGNNQANAEIDTKKILSGAGLTDAAKAHMTATYNTQADLAAANNTEAMNQKDFSLAYSVVYNTGRSLAGASENVRNAEIAALTKEYGNWAQDAFKIGVSDAQNAEADRITNLKKPGSGIARNATETEISKYFKNGEATTVRLSTDKETRARQEAEIAVHEYVASALGLQVRFFSSVGDKTDNAFVTGDGTIYVDTNAGEGSNRSMLRAFTHELTHWMSRTAAKEYGTLRSFIIDKYYGADNNLFDSRIAQYMKNDERLTADGATEELIADHCEQMLKDTTAIRQLAEQNKSAWQKIKDFIDTIIKGIKAVLEKVGAYSKAAQDFENDLDYWNEVQRLWDEGLVAAAQAQFDELVDDGFSEEIADSMVENGLTLEANGIVATDIASESSEVVPPDTGITSSPRTTPIWKRNFKEKVKYDSMSDDEKAEVDAFFAAVEAFDERLGLEKQLLQDSDTNAFFVSDSMGPLRTNQEYRWSFDIALSCPRTFQFLAFVQELQRRFGRPLTNAESTNLIEIMKATGQEIPCTYCYSEVKRMLLSGSFCNYFAYRRAVIDRYNENISKGMSEADAIDDAAHLSYGWQTKKGVTSQTKAGREEVEFWISQSKYNVNVETATANMLAFRSSAFGYLDDLLKSGNVMRGSTDTKIEVGPDGSRQRVATTEGGTSVQELVRKLGAKFGLYNAETKAYSARFVEQSLTEICADWKYDVSAKLDHDFDLDVVYEETEEYARNGYGSLGTVLSSDYAGWKYAKSASSAKLVADYVPYDHQLDNISEEDKRYINSMGGLRKHSTNDFRLDYVQDYFLLFADMQRGGWFGHTYTKSADYVRIFGRTGDKINMSIAATTRRQADGSVVIVENNQEGFVWKTAQELRKNYPNAGVMMMVTDAAQFEWALQQDWIDMIIPYHASGLEKITMARRGWENYQSVQNETWLTEKELVAALKKLGYDEASLPKKKAGAVAEETEDESESEDDDLPENSRKKKAKEKYDVAALRMLYLQNSFQGSEARKYVLSYLTEDVYKLNKPHFYPYDRTDFYAVPNPETGQFEYVDKDGNDWVEGESKGDRHIKKFPVTIPGHHNNVQEYFRLCDLYGVHPRFWGTKMNVYDKNGVQQFTPKKHEAKKTQFTMVGTDGKRHLLTDYDENFVPYVPSYLKLIKETSRTGENPLDVVDPNSDSPFAQHVINANVLTEYDEHLGMTPMQYAEKRLLEEPNQSERAKFRTYLANDQTNIHIVDNFEKYFKGLDHYVDPRDFAPFRARAESLDAAKSYIRENGLKTENGWVSQADFETLSQKYYETHTTEMDNIEFDSEGIRVGSDLRANRDRILAEAKSRLQEAQNDGFIQRSSRMGDSERERLQTGDITRNDLVRMVVGPDSYYFSDSYQDLRRQARELFSRYRGLREEAGAERRAAEAGATISDDARELGPEYAYLFASYTPDGEAHRTRARELDAEAERVNDRLERVTDEIRRRDMDARAKQNASGVTDVSIVSDDDEFRGFRTDSDVPYISDALESGKATMLAMSPSDYLALCSSKVFEYSSIESAIGGGAVDPETVQKYAKMMRDGTKFYAPYVNLKRGQESQEGRHRALAAMLNGYDRIPVAVISDRSQSSARSRLSGTDMVEAMQSYEGLSAEAAESARKVKSLLEQYHANVRAVNRINEDIRNTRADLANASSGNQFVYQTRLSLLQDRHDKALQERKNLAVQIDTEMEKDGLRTALERERNYIEDLIDEGIGAGVNYINDYYNEPMQNAISAEQARTQAARERTERVRNEARERLDRREREWRDRMDRLRDRYNDRFVRMAARMADQRTSFRQQLRDRAERTARRVVSQTVVRRVAALTRQLSENTERRHVPEFLKGPLTEFLRGLNPASQRDTLRGADERAAWAEALRVFDNISDRDGITAQTVLIVNQYAEDINALRTAADRIVASFYDYISDEDWYDSFTGDQIGNAVIAANEFGGRLGALAADQAWVIEAMSLQELQTLNRVLTAFQQIISNANRIFTESRHQTVQEMVQRSDTELRTIQGDPTIIPSNNKLSKEEMRLQNSLAWKNGTPYYVFQRFMSVGAERFEAIAEGWAKLAFNAQKCIDFANRTWTTKEARQWSKAKKTITLRDEDGNLRETVMTEAQLMSLYCHTKQEDSMVHITGKGLRVGSDPNLKSDPDYYTPAGDLAALFSLKNPNHPLSEHQIKVADAVMDFMTHEGAQMGNAISMQLFGFNYFDEAKPYFPIVVDPSQKGRTGEGEERPSSITALLHMTTLRPRVPNADEAIVINNIFDVFATHMTDMCKYNALAFPVLDMANWLNGRVRMENGHDHFIRQDLERAFGMVEHKSTQGTTYSTSPAVEYVEQFLRDLNTTTSQGDLVAKDLDRLLSRMKRAAVAASLRVVIQQPFSYVRAMYSINPKYLAKALVPTLQLSQDVAEAKAHSGLALSKSQGYFSTNIAPSLKEKIMNTGTVIDTVTEKATWLAQKADEKTWGILWRASKMKVENEGYDGRFYKKGTGGYWRAVTKTFDQIILSTQVMDGTITRSPYMRDTKFYTKIFTLFMAEPTLSYNMALDSFSKYKLAKRTGGDMKAARQRVGLALITYAATQIANALVTAIIDAFRDDDDYESFLEKYFDHAKKNLLDNANPLEGIPVPYMIWKLLNAWWTGGKSPLGQEFQGIETAVKALRAIVDTMKGQKTEANYYGKMTTWGMIYTALQAVSYLTGIPFANASKVVTSTRNTIATIWNDVFAQSTGKYLEHWTTYDSDTNGFDGLYEALLKNNEDRIESLTLELMAHGYDESEIGKQIRTRVRTDYLESSISEAKANALLEEYGYDEEDRKKMLNDWRFRRDYSNIDNPTSGMANQWYSTFQRLGITAEEFARHYRALYAIESQENGPSRKDQWRQYINDLPYTYTVKVALWRMEYSSAF